MAVFSRRAGDTKVNQPHETDAGDFLQPHKGRAENVAVNDLREKDNRQQNHQYIRKGALKCQKKIAQLFHSAVPSAIFVVHLELFFLA
jgi:hypothetical protein